MVSDIAVWWELVRFPKNITEKRRRRSIRVGLKCLEGVVKRKTSGLDQGLGLSVEFSLNVRV